MDLFVYGTEGEALRLKGVIDTAEKIIWKRRFTGGDVFEIILPCTEKNSALFTAEAIIEIPERCSGIVTKINLFVKDGMCFIRGEGCSFEGLFARRVLVKCAADDSVMTVLDKNAGELADEERRFPAMKIDTETDFTGMANYDYIRGSLAAYIAAAGKKGFGVRSGLVHECCNAYIRIYGRYGTDRSVEQNGVTQLVYSDAYENISDGEYVYNENGAVTSAYVYSEAKEISGYNIGSWNKFYGNDYSGLKRCEKAYRIEPQVTYVPISTANGVEYVPEIDTDASENYGRIIYKTNFSSFKENMRAVIILKGEKIPFDTGDKITIYCMRFDRLLSGRVYEIKEIWENGRFTAEVTAEQFTD